MIDNVLNNFCFIFLHSGFLGPTAGSRPDQPGTATIFRSISIRIGNASGETVMTGSGTQVAYFCALFRIIGPIQRVL